VSKMIVSVSFLVGTNLLEAIEEAKYKCILWDLAYVEFKFNGVDVSISQNCDCLEAFDYWKNNSPKGDGYFVF
jgi:hypothetical protein